MGLRLLALQSIQEQNWSFPIPLWSSGLCCKFLFYNKLQITRRDVWIIMLSSSIIHPSNRLLLIRTIYLVLILFKHDWSVSSGDPLISTLTQATPDPKITSVIFVNRIRHTGIVHLISRPKDHFQVAVNFSELLWTNNLYHVLITSVDLITFSLEDSLECHAN